MLPEVVWNMPRFGTFNLHASLLPQYRGAAPINWAIINGEKETGVTTFFLTHEIDTGRIIRQQRLPISEKDDAGTIHDSLMTLGAGLVIETVDMLLENDGRVDAIPQETLLPAAGELRLAPKIFKETCRIQWNRPLKDLYNFIRGLSPYPAAWCEMVGTDGSRQTLKIYDTKKQVAVHPYPAGSLQSDGKTYIDVVVPDGYLRILSLQLAGKKRLCTKDFLNGFKNITDYKFE